jgi:nitroreductase
VSQHNSRKADHPASQIFLDRWSPRSFTDEAIPDETLMTLFEAARWAPSSYNSQPWCFLYAKRDDADFTKFLGLLSERNQSWAKKAAVLLILVSKTTMRPPGSDKDMPARTHSLDTGAAWANFALQASMSGWHAHGMAGVDYERARAELNVPEGYHIECAIAVGRRGAREALPEGLRAAEEPNQRRPLTESILRGGFPKA